MRDIKFRAWDKKYKEWCNPESWFINPNGKPCFGDEGGWPDITERLELSQYTGRKDKNGKDIYEGDILKEIDWWWGPCFVFFSVGETGPYGDNIMGWCLGKCIEDPKKHAIYNIWNSSRVEIIGNTHENPELIN